MRRWLVEVLELLFQDAMILAQEHKRTWAGHGGHTWLLVEVAKGWQGRLGRGGWKDSGDSPILMTAMMTRIFRGDDLQIWMKTTITVTPEETTATTRTTATTGYGRQRSDPAGSGHR